jgi:hypothetical protein
MTTENPTSNNQWCEPQAIVPRTNSLAAYNTGLAKVAVQCYPDTFVVNQNLVLRINISGENRHLRQAFSVSSNATDSL